MSVNVQADKPIKPVFEETYNTVVTMSSQIEPWNQDHI